MPPPVRWKLPLACSRLLASRSSLPGLRLRATVASRPPAEVAEREADPATSTGSSSGFSGVIFVVVEARCSSSSSGTAAADAPREREGPQIHGHKRLELIWTVIPVVILAVIVGFVFYKLPGIKDTPDATAAGARS